MTGIFVENVVMFTVALLSLKAALAAASGGGLSAIGLVGPAAALSKARETFGNVIKDLLMILPTLKDRFIEAATGIKTDVFRRMQAGRIRAGEAIYELVADAIADIRDGLAQVVLSQGLERSGVVPVGTSIDTKLRETHDALNTDGGLRRVASEDLAANKEAVVTGVRRELSSTKESFDRLEVIPFVTDLFDGVAQIVEVIGGTTLTALSTASSIVLSFVSASIEFANLFNTLPGLFDVRGEHNRTLDRIVTGEFPE